MATGDQQSGGDKVVAQINSVADIIGTLVPAVGAIGTMVRLIASAVRPSDAQKAQVFDDAIAQFDAQIAGLNTAIAGFETAKAQAPNKVVPAELLKDADSANAATKPSKS